MCLLPGSTNKSVKMQAIPVAPLNFIPFFRWTFLTQTFMDPPKASGDTSSTITGCTAETLGFFQKPNFPKSLGEKSSYPICEINRNHL